MTALRRIEAEVYASHHQFYVVDPEARFSEGGDLWDGGGLERHLGVADGIVAVGTVGHTYLPVAIELWDAEPPLDEGWDHVVEATLEVGSGRLGLESVDGAAEDVEALEVEPGTYRVRSSSAGLEEANEMDGGDSYRVQLWPAPAAEPRVLRWWPAWDPAGARAQPTTTGGRLLLGAEAHDARVQMAWMASRGTAHLFRDDDGVLWEHSTLHDAAGTAQLEELDEAEAERRYGHTESWKGAAAVVPGLGSLAKALWQTVRYQQGWRPEPDPTEPVIEDGRRVYLGNTAMNRLVAMRWLASEAGEGLYRDEDGSLWEYCNADAATGRPRLSELTPAEAREKYGVDGA